MPRIEVALAAVSGTYWMADSSTPAPRPTTDSTSSRPSRQRRSGSVAYAAAIASVVANVTGSPASAWVETTTASSALDPGVRRSKRRSMAQNTYGTAATDHDMFGKLVVDTTSPDTANAIAPNADATGAVCRRRNRYIPHAASGTGRATHALYARVSGSRRRTSSDGTWNS